MSKQERIKEIEKRLKEIEEELERRLGRNEWDNEALWIEQERLKEELERIKRYPGITFQNDDEEMER